jgi:hypothetical protein
VPTLLRDSHFVLERYPEPGFIRLARTAEPLHTHAEVMTSLAACRRALGPLDPAELGLLLDWRLSPTLLEVEALQEAAIRDADAFATQFARKAVLLLTPASTLASAWANMRAEVFHDEDAAIAHVSG